VTAGARHDAFDSALGEAERGSLLDHSVVNRYCGRDRVLGCIGVAAPAERVGREVSPARGGGAPAEECPRVFKPAMFKEDAQLGRDGFGVGPPTEDIQCHLGTLLKRQEACLTTRDLLLVRGLFGFRKHSTPSPGSLSCAGCSAVSASGLRSSRPQGRRAPNT